MHPLTPTHRNTKLVIQNEMDSTAFPSVIGGVGAMRNKIRRTLCLLIVLTLPSASYTGVVFQFDWSASARFVKL